MLVARSAAAAVRAGAGGGDRERAEDAAGRRPAAAVEDLAGLELNRIRACLGGRPGSRWVGQPIRRDDRTSPAGVGVKELRRSGKTIGAGDQKVGVAQTREAHPA